MTEGCTESTEDDHVGLRGHYKSGNYTRAECKETEQSS